MTNQSLHQLEHYELIHQLSDNNDLITHLGWNSYEETFCSIVMLRRTVGDHVYTLMHLEHPHIVPISQIEVVDDASFVVRQYMPGGTLRQHISLVGSYNPAEALRHLAPVVDAIDALHEASIAHFGLCPDVILREADGTFAVADAALVPYVLNGPYLPEMMRPYAAPELYLRTPFTATIDVYALGAIYYEMVTGYPPFHGVTYTQQMAAHLNQHPSLSDDTPHVSPELMKVIARAMEKSPYLRYQTASEFYAALLEVIHGTKTVVEPQPQKTPRRKMQKVRYPTTVSGENPSQLYTDALISESQNPQEAIRLYHRLMEIAPQHMQGGAIQRLRRLEERIEAEKIHSQMVEAREARTLGDWRTLRSLTKTILSYDPEHDEARKLWQIGEMLYAADRHYQAAVTAANGGYWGAAFMLLNELFSAVPDYVDSYELASIRAENAAYVYEYQAVNAHDAQVLSLSFSAMDGALATGSTDKSVRLWRMPDAQPLYTFDDHSTWVCSTSFSPDGGLLLAGTWEGLIKIWDVNEGDYSGVIAGQTSQVRAMSFATHDPTLLATAAGYFLTLWRMPEGKRLAVVRDSERNPVTAVTFAPHSPLLISGLQNGELRIRDIERDANVIMAKSQPHTGPIYSVTVSPDGSLLATASRDGTACLCELETGQPVIILEGHTDAIHDVAFSKDGSVIATAGRDKQIMLWRVDDGSLLATLQGHYDEVRSVAFSPDGRTLVSGGADGYVKVWRML